MTTPAAIPALSIPLPASAAHTPPITCGAAVPQAETLAAAVLDSMEELIAVLDPSGLILSVNRAWRLFVQAAVPGLDATSPIGLSFLSVGAWPGLAIPEDLRAASAAGIRAVLAGAQPVFVLDYPCQAPQAQRWFRMRVVPLQGARPGAVVSHLDITEVKTLRSALDDRGRIYREIVTQANEGIALVDLDSDSFVEFNDALCAMLGYSREEFFRLKVGDIRSQRDDEMSFTERVQYLRNEGQGEYEVQYRHKDGGWRDLLLRCRTIELSGRTHVITVGNDITQRKASEKELLAHRDHLEDLVQRKTRDLQHSASLARRALDDFRQQQFVLDQHAIVSIADLDGRITYCNERFSQISGYSRDELLGRDHAILNSGHHPQGFFKSMYATLGRGQVWNAEVCNRAKDGHLYWVQSTLAAFNGDDGQPRAYIAVRTDVTERRRYEQMLSASVSVLNATLDATAEGILVVDMDGRLARWNQRFMDLWEMPQSLLEQQDRSEGLRHMVSQVEQPEAFVARIRDLYAHPQESGLDLIKLRDGRVYNRSSQPQRIGSEVVGRVWSFADITEQKRAEEAAVASSRIKSEFLAHMSHEIRTPMNGVVGMVEILQQSELQPEQHRMLGTVHQSSLALLHILNDILDFSKIEAGKLDLEDLATHLRDLVEGSVQLIVNSVTKPIDLTVFVAPELPRWIWCDPTRLRQVLLNLMGNAVKFTAPRDGQPPKVIVRVQPCTLDDDSSGFELRVTDNGIGMSPQVLATLFQPFAQAESSTARKFGGTGLGLSITHLLVEMMGGRMSVRSKLGEGSEFSVKLPLRGAQAGGMSLFEPSLEGVHVVGVSSDETTLEIFPAYCRAAGAQVTMVPDMAVARRLLLERAPSGSTVVVLSPNVSTAREGLDLPEGVGVVWMVRRNSKACADEIRLPIRPMLYLDLVQAVARAVGSFSASDSVKTIVRSVTLASGPAPSVEQALAQGRLILMAEDNETNRDVMQEQLRLLGHVAEMAQDGVQALQMWRSGRYALLLTDCHMPVMDGFELTAAIRQDEIGRRRPIIAVTAAAMLGEVRRCLDSGMDDVLAKPLHLKSLGAMLAKWLPDAPARPEVAVVPSPLGDAATQVWDRESLSRLVGQNPAMQRRLLERFLLSAQAQVVTISGAAGTDIATLVDTAHTLKSAALTVGAVQLAEHCQAIERAGTEDDLKSCLALSGGLAAIYDAASAAISSSLQG